MTNTTTITVTIAKAAAAAGLSVTPAMWNTFDSILAAVTVILTAVVVIIAMLGLWGIRSIKSEARQVAQETTKKEVDKFLEKFKIGDIIQDSSARPSDKEQPREDKNA